MDKILYLSIYMTTYNHASYIQRALDSILMQKTKYSYEVLIGDDVSQDETRKILREYEIKYPGRFQIYYRDYNMYNKSPNNGEDLRSRCKGKYVIALEGDDFWLDENKIEKQISFLEEHPDYVAVAHKCMVVGKDSQPLDEAYPECKENDYRFSHYVSEIIPGQLTTVMYRNNIFDEGIDSSILKCGMMPWDKALYFVLTAKGKIYCMQETMSAYRHVTSGGSSFSANNRYDFWKTESWQNKLLQYAYDTRNEAAIKCAEILYYTRLVHGFVLKECSFVTLIHLISDNVKHPYKTLFLYMRYKINKNLLKKNIYITLD